jgi:methanol--5-hydroxybenzimidazolylcobamide Co-methyltransferase
MGNLAAACCDTWSNETVQNIKLLGGMAPTCFIEQLAYDCQLMNQARLEGPDAACSLQRWLVNSDAALDPQAFIISTHSSIELAKAIVACDSHYHAGVAVARRSVELLRDAAEDNRLRIAPNEFNWLENMLESLDELPDCEEEFISQQIAVADSSKFFQPNTDCSVRSAAPKPWTANITLTLPPQAYACRSARILCSMSMPTTRTSFSTANGWEPWWRKPQTASGLRWLFR